MPYHGVSARILFSLLSGDEQRAERGWRDLLYRKSKYSVKHPIEQNAFCIKQIKEYSAEFLKITGAEKLGIYGSLARGTDTEYSDADIIAVIKSDADIIAVIKSGADAKDVKRQAHEFWADKLPLRFDIRVTTESGLANLSIGIRRTV